MRNRGERKKRIEAKKKEISVEKKFYIASQGQLMWRKFKKHKLAIGGNIVLIIFYSVAIFAEFIAPYGILERTPYRFSPPQRIHFFDEDGQFHLRPFVYEMEKTIDPETYFLSWIDDKTKRYPIYFFVHGTRYKLWRLFETDLHLFGTKEKELKAPLLFGTATLGRDLFSRTIYASRISLSIGLVGVAISFILGCILGGISGYFGGVADMIIQRIIEFFLCLPSIPLWMALAAAVPQDWSIIKTYFAITIILSFMGWCGLARVVRGKLIALREEDFALAAKIAGSTNRRIILKHLLPSFSSYLIVSLTLAVPYMILGETALSFLGLGIRPPAVSWGTLLEEAQNLTVIASHPWLLIPGLFVIIVVLAFNFVGDGLRDAADPYK